MLDNITGILYLILILSVLVIAHEWGHFIAARLCKMRVEEFSLFFGPPLLRFGRRGDTEYNIRSIPLGGFVRIAGMDPDDVSGGRPLLEAIRHPQSGADNMDGLLRQLDTDTMAGMDVANVSQEIRNLIRSAVGADGTLTSDGKQELQGKLHSPQITTDEHKLIELVLNADMRATDNALYSRKPIYQRALVIFAGPLASLLFGYLLFCLMGMTVGLPSDKPVTNQVQVMPYLKDKSEKPSPAKQAGLRTGDRIVAINGKPTPDGKTMAEVIHKSANVPLTLTVERDGMWLTVQATPEPTKVTYEDEKGKKVTETWGLLGVAPTPVFERRGIVGSVVLGTLYTYRSVEVLLRILTSRRELKENVGGPIAMGQAAIAVQKLGPAHLAMMAASLSLNLGIMNLLPIPILDGGHLLLLGVEKIRRRKLSPREVYRTQLVGLGLLGLLIIFVMYNDIARTIAGKAFQ